MRKKFDERAIKSELGETIKNKRKQKRLTQEELSEIVGITEVYLRDLERGSYTATWIICLKICAALDIDLKEIQRKYIIPEITELQRKQSLKKNIKELKKRRNTESSRLKAISRRNFVKND